MLLHLGSKMINYEFSVKLLKFQVFIFEIYGNISMKKIRKVPLGCVPLFFLFRLPGKGFFLNTQGPDPWEKSLPLEDERERIENRIE